MTWHFKSNHRFCPGISNLDRSVVTITELFSVMEEGLMSVLSEIVYLIT